MKNPGPEAISEALERLALSLGESGAVPLPELVRALERAAERLRTRTVSADQPTDLVTQAEASRSIGVSRQAVNQWVRSGLLKSYVRDGGTSRYAPEVSLSEVAVVANRRSREVPFSATRRRELLDFLGLLRACSADQVAAELGHAIEDDDFSVTSRDQTRVLSEFVLSSMSSGDQQSDFTPEGVKLLAEMDPRFEVDRSTAYGRLMESLGLLVFSTSGRAGFDSPATALIGLLGASTLGALYPGNDADEGRAVAKAARAVWGTDWLPRLYDAAFHVSGLRPSPLVRYTASLTYLDHNRFLRQAQSAGVSVHYARGPGLILPQRFYGAPVVADLIDQQGRGSQSWQYDATGVPFPADLPSGENPFRVFNYVFGLVDTSIHGIRRYCFSTVDARRELRSYAQQLPAGRRERYLDLAVQTLARTLAERQVELVAIDHYDDFDWWKDHIIRASSREVLIGLRDEQARKTAHALLVETSLLPDVVEAADSDTSLRDRLRIYVKNLEFDVIDARYRDDLRRGTARLIKAGGQGLGGSQAEEVAHAEIHAMLAD